MKKKNQKTTEMSDYILSILQSNKPVFDSWGHDNNVKLENGLQFDVNGFIFQGQVKIVYDEGMDDFTVFLIKDGKITDRTDGVYLDNLVDVIDQKVECNVSKDEYRDMVLNHYKDLI